MIARWAGCCTRAVDEDSGATSARHSETSSWNLRSRSGPFRSGDWAWWDGSADEGSVFAWDMAATRSPGRAGRSPRRSGWRQVLPLRQIIQKIEGQATACIEWLTSLLQVGPGNRSGQAPSTGTDRGNESPGAPWLVKSRPRNRNWGRGLGFSLARVFAFPRLPLSQVKVPDQSFSLPEFPICLLFPT